MTVKKRAFVDAGARRRFAEVVTQVRRAPLSKRDQTAIAKDLRKHWHKCTAAEQGKIGRQWASTGGVKKKTTRVSVILEPAEGGWWVVSMPTVPGAHTQGKTPSSALRHLADVIHTFDQMRRDGLLGNKAQAAALRRLARRP